MNVADFFVTAGKPTLEHLLGLAHVLTGVSLMYLTVACVLNIASGYPCRPAETRWSGPHAVIGLLARRWRLLRRSGLAVDPVRVPSWR